jgi:predicted nucleotidyltransferase
MKLEAFLERVIEWAAGQPQVASIALVGSHARGTACSSSDIDLVLRVEHPVAFIQDRTWTSTFGHVVRIQDEDWGRVRSLRVWYADGMEVEFGITDLGWGADPEDASTQQVIRDGHRELYSRGHADTTSPGRSDPKT